MANYNADIQIAVKGKSQLNQLESQLKRTQKVLNQLNKQLNFRAKVQAIRLDTRQANTAISNLEKRINRLGRTINVNLRVNEKEGRRSSSGASGAATAPVVVAARRQEAKRVDSQQTAMARYRSMTEAQRTINKLQKEQVPFLDKAAKKQAEIAEQVQKIKKNRTEAANVERGFGTQQRLNQLNFGYDAQIKKLNRLRTEYKAVNDAARDLQRTEKAVQDQIGVAAEKRRQQVNDLRRRKARNTGLRNAAGAGIAGAAFQVPGLGGIAAGGAAGFALGGPAGAAIGAGAAALTEASVALVAFGNDAAKTAAQVSKLELALENVTGGGERFKQALASIRDVVDDYNTPLDDATAQFTKLTAAGQASGFTIEELSDVYKGLAAANKALGGDSERLSGILLATTQVFSKGKVQAEELRGQIGERLPGAFALFAKATGRTTKELDKALNDGEVSLKDFITFARDLFETYDKDAQVIADSPEEAGARLEKAMTDLKVNVGGELAALGARFQDFATAAIQALDSVFDKLGRLGREIEARLGGLPTDKIENAAERLRRAQISLQNARNNNNQVGIEIFGRAVTEASNDLYGVFTPPTTPPKSTPDPDAPKTGGGSSSGGAARKSRVPELQRELALDQELFRLQGLRNQAELESNQRELIRLDTQMKLAELVKQEGDIRASDVPDQEKVLQLLQNQVAVARVGQDEAQQLALLERDRLKAVEDLVTAAENELALLGAETELARDLLTIEQELAALRGDPNSNFSEDDIARIKQARTNLALAKEEQRQYNELLAAAQPFADAFATGLTSGLQEVVAGTKTAEEAFADFLKNIADLLVQTAAQMIAQYIAIGIARSFAGIPAPGGSGLSGADPNKFNLNAFGNLFTPGGQSAFAEGGRPEVGAVSIVGERGPELFVPDQPGRIISNRDSQVALQRYNPANARSIEELAMGGMYNQGSKSGFLGPVAAPETTFKLETVVINGVEYATVDQVRKMGLQATKQGAKQGEAMTLRRLQMSPASRRKVGL